MRTLSVPSMNRPFSLLLILCIITAAVAPLLAGPGTWRSYTSMNDVRAVASDGHTLWAATGGGLFRFDPSDSSYTKFVNSDGLSSNNVTAVYADTTGTVWVGHYTGELDIYNGKKGTWSTIENIAQYPDQNRSINGFFRNGNSMVIAAGFGVVVYNIAKGEFSETYAGFASVTRPSVAAAAVLNGRYIAASDKGILVSKAGAVNLAAPESWEIQSPVTTGRSVSIVNGSAYVSSASGLLLFNGSSWSVAAGISGNVTTVAATGSLLYYVEGNALRSLLPPAVITTVSATVPFAVSGGTLHAGAPWLVFPAHGIGSLSEGAWRTYGPNGPAANGFYQIVVDETGTLWSASGRSNANGFYSFNGARWRNYTTANTPLLLNNDCFAIGLGPNNSKWISTWGDGMVVVNAAGEAVKRYDYADPGLTGVVRNQDDGIPSYTVPSRAAMDRSGNMWFSCYKATNKLEVVWKLKPDSSWEKYPGTPYGGFNSFMFGAYVDRNNTKWFTNTAHGRPADYAVITFFDETKKLSGTTTDGWGALTAEDGATDTRTEAIVFDRDGALWIGTGAGITIVNDVSNPKSRVTKVFNAAVRESYINCIAVDPLNNKWVGTQSGVYVLSPDGTQLLSEYTVKSTGGKLIDNNILSIAFDTRRGLAYFGTETGLSSLEIDAVEPKNSISAIDLSPNPVYLPNHSAVEIRGLVEESTVKVLALNGSVVRQFAAQGGGRAFWDMKDERGRMVSSGVYIVVAHNRAGDQVGSAKLAVIRK